MTRLADAVYRLMLRALPSSLRHQFGDDLVQMFRDHRRQASGRPLRLILLWVVAARDIVASPRAARVAAPDGAGVLRACAFDLRHGVRLLRRYPAMSAAALLTLAIGIGANTAMFSVVNAVLLRALPYPDPDRLVMAWETRKAEGVATNVSSPADFLDWRSRAHAFTSMAATLSDSATLTGGGDPVELDAELVSWSFFDVLGVTPEWGRTFQPRDERADSSHVVILSHRTWSLRFGADPAIVGRDIQLDGTPFRVIGVLPATFRFVNGAVSLWRPLVLETPGHPATRVGHHLDVYARIAPGVSFAQARDEMDRLGQLIEQEHPAENRGHGATITHMRDELIEPVGARLWLLFAAVGFVQLIVCVNIGNLLTARAATRQRERAVRAALGASRLRLVAQGVTESAVLALGGGVLGAALAEGVLKVLPLVMPAQLSVVALSDVRLDLPVLTFALLLSLATGLAFGVWPALQSSDGPLADALKQGGRGPGGVKRRTRLAIVTSEVALAALMLVGAGLTIRSFAETLSQPLGFDTRSALTFEITLPASRYRTPALIQGGFREIEARAASIPGVTGVTAINLLPLGDGDRRAGVEIEGVTPQAGEPPTRMYPRIVTPTYFSVMHIPLRGRAFSPADSASALPVVIISDMAARRFWPNQDPIGRRVRFAGDDTWRLVIGVAGDVRHWGLSGPMHPMLYWPLAQTTGQASALTFVLKTNVAPLSIVDALRHDVATVDPSLPLASVESFDDIVSDSVQAERAQSLLMGTFAGVALLLATMGIYGVMTQLASARAGEIGVRMTLGARPIDIFRQLIGEGVLHASIGLTIGLAAGVALMAVARTLLFHVLPWDPLTLSSAAVLLLAASVAATLVPARRAMRLDAADVMRQS